MTYFIEGLHHSVLNNVFKLSRSWSYLDNHQEQRGWLHLSFWKYDIIVVVLNVAGSQFINFESFHSLYKSFCCKPWNLFTGCWCGCCSKHQLCHHKWQHPGFWWIRIYCGWSWTNFLQEFFGFWNKTVLPISCDHHRWSEYRNYKCHSNHPSDCVGKDCTIVLLVNLKNSITLI